ncbi:hypothetical protein CALVIDRAFT_123237 [Calocera viscosa TUFC12733]|uniref:PRA1 family protein n=1 Tax=Calocera viscosa (strain TUFC12733) TaxID=1330018 RepID=A0A167RNE4_CALVF|nr:hypothetical protein CALVIDRAFT_123237 [Calocera viscosa TUFC12733]
MVRKAYLFALVRKFLAVPSSALPTHAHHGSSSSTSSLLPSLSSPRIPLPFRSRRPRGSTPPTNNGLLGTGLTLVTALQRLPIFTHLFVVLLVIFGPYYAPVTLSLVFLLTHLAFMLSQFRSAYGMIRWCAFFPPSWTRLLTCLMQLVRRTATRTH